MSSKKHNLQRHQVAPQVFPISQNCQKDHLLVLAYAERSNLVKSCLVNVVRIILYVLSVSIKGSPDSSLFIFEINVGKRRIRHTSTINLNNVSFRNYWKWRDSKFVVLCGDSPVLRISVKVPMFWKRPGKGSTNLDAQWP